MDQLTKAAKLLSHALKLKSDRPIACAEDRSKMWGLSRMRGTVPITSNFVGKCGRDRPGPRKFNFVGREGEARMRVNLLINGKAAHFAALSLPSKRD